MGLMGPGGFAEIGETIIAKSAYRRDDAIIALGRARRADRGLFEFVDSG